MANPDTKVIFLHIPKTAGQSVHAALVNGFGEEAVCPARVNDQLVGASIAELNRYRVFSGHLDWSLLDCVSGPRFVFTVLREPRDRILSFYFYLREQAAKLSPEALEKPHHQGMRAALKLSPDEYFSAGPPGIRRFIDDHYDNFYTYFFAGRYYAARGPLNARILRGDLTREDLLERALDNLRTLDAVFHVGEMSAVFDKLRELSGAPLQSDDMYRANVNAAVEAGERSERLRQLGATALTFQSLDRFCSLDNRLWAHAMGTSGGAS